MGATQDVSASIRACFVSSTNPEKATVKVKIPDLDNLISHDLQVVFQKTLKDKEYWLPDVDEEVLCLFLGNGLECGFVLGSLYNAEDKPPVVSQDKRHITFEDGTALEYDRKEHKLKADVKGEVELTATGRVKVMGSRIDLN